MSETEAGQGSLDAGQFPCEQCGAHLIFKAGSNNIVCHYCGHQNAIEAVGTIDEIDFRFAEDALNEVIGTESVLTVRCETCAAEFNFTQDETAGLCPFCGSGAVAAPHENRVLKPQALMPFSIDERAARDHLFKWLKNLWFAPSAVKNLASQNGQLKGVYVPFFTYDCNTRSRYRGQRGDAYYVTRTRTVQTKNGSRTETYQERRIRWTPVSGQAHWNFDDILVAATRHWPRKFLNELSPWGIKDLTPYTPEYLAGFRAEQYSISLQEGFSMAQTAMKPVIREEVRRNIGGDEQRIDNISTEWLYPSFKHILLPVWTAAYRFRGKAFRFFINGVTGEVQGDRPYSWPKIVAAAVAGLVVAAALLGALYISENGGIEAFMRDGLFD